MFCLSVNVLNQLMLWMLLLHNRCSKCCYPVNVGKLMLLCLRGLFTLVIHTIVL